MTRRVIRFSAAATSLAALLIADPARAQSAANVLLVVNDASVTSTRIGEYYAKKRAIPQDQVVHLKLDAAPKDDIAPAAYSTEIQAPIAKWIAQHNAHDRILYIVLTKGIPLRVAGTSGRNGTVASVDSELALLYRRMAGVAVAPAGPIANPYFLGDAPAAQARPFTHEVCDIFLVTRLDGFSVDDVLAMIDRGATPVATGRFLLDERAAWNDKGNDWLQAAADWLNANGFGSRVTLDKTSAVLANEPNVMGYFSWGSNDPDIKQRHLGLKFVPGAIAATFVSTDARTFAEPPAYWHTGSWSDQTTFYAGSPQSLVGDLVHDGVTGAAGQVAEPYLDGTIRPNVLFPAYVSGLNLAEAFYLAMPYVSWQTVVLGDPLCTPFPRKVLTSADIEKGVDAPTELPALFARRALRAAATRTTNGDVVNLLVKADGRLARDDKPGARTALEQATALDSRMVAAQLTLASLYEDAKEYDKAIERYRAVLALDSNNIVALNNLAYGLAVRQNRPSEAVAPAERAHTLAGANAPALDTLGWVYHLNGDDKRAAPLLAQAAKLAPSNGDIQLHMAVVYAAGGMIDAAILALGRAVELDPALDKSPEAIALRAKLKGPVK